MENSITDLFADSSNSPAKPKEKSKAEKKDKSSSLKSSMMMEAMGLMSNPKKLKGIIAVLVLLLVVGIVSTVAFFVIYPVCLLWALGACIVVAIGRKIIRYKR